MKSSRVRQRLNSIKQMRVSCSPRKKQPNMDCYKSPPDKKPLPPDVILLGNEDTGKMPVPFDTEDDCPMPAREKIKVQKLTPAEEFEIMVPGQTVLDYYNAKVMLLIGKCEDIPTDLKMEVFKAVIDDISGTPLEEKISDVAAKLGVYSGETLPPPKVAVKIWMPEQEDLSAEKDAHDALTEDERKAYRETAEGRCDPNGKPHFDYKFGRNPWR
jgi:hypothetical protein